MPKKKFILEFRRAPGDVLMMTGLVRDLKLTYGDEYEVDVRTQFPAIWRHNDYLTKFSRSDKGIETIHLGGSNQDAADRVGMKLSQQGNKLHYATVFHRVFEEKTGIHVPVLHPHADLHISPEEKKTPFVSGRYWMIVPGGKTDMSTKWWLDYRYQEVVDQLRPEGLRFIQEGATKKMHHHPPLENVLNLIGQTSVRDLIVNLYHAEGVICGCTFQMHIAGALQKPCVVILGGREEPWYEEYSDQWEAFGPDAAPTKVPHRVLHTLGKLNCCLTNGCWKRRIQRLNDGRKDYDNSLCLLPNHDNQAQVVPECMAMIKTSHVTDAVRSYYKDGTLKPIEPTVVPATPRKTILSQDLFVPPSAGQIVEPKIIHPTEHMQTGQAKGAPVMPAFRDFLPPGQTAEDPLPSSPPRRDTNLGSAARGPMEVLDHPKIGGKFTIFVLLYGHENRLHRRCLDSICETVPPSRMDLRVICNQVSVDTLNYIKTRPATRVYVDHGNRTKFAAMRDVFNDPEAPIKTKWIIWFDDIAYVRHGRWITVLAETIINQPDESNVGAMGLKQMHKLQMRNGKDPRNWFSRAPWFRGQDFQDKHGRATPNGEQIHYVNTNFFALRTDAIERCQIPDQRIRQSGGSVCIGEQLHQGGYQSKLFSAHSNYIDSQQHAKRRGRKDKYPWL